MKLKPIKDQVVVLCGASSGIGRETAKRFAAKGARVVVAARDEAGLDSLVDQIEAAGGEATAVPCDVADFKQVQRLADAAVRLYGRLDTWVHLAAVSLYATFEQTTPEEFSQVIDVNLKGTAHGCMAALPHLRQGKGGALICISSVEARRALPFQAAYASSKHGVKGMVDALRLELEHEGAPISVTNIMPASIDTPFFNKARTKLGVKPQGVKPVYDPSVVADAILYAAEHPVRELYAGGAGKMIGAGEAVAPGFLDKILSATAFEGQKTDEPKSESAPDNLFEALPGFDRERGDLNGRGSLYTKATTNPWASIAIAGGLMGLAALFASRTMGRDREGSEYDYGYSEPSENTNYGSSYTTNEVVGNS